MSFIYEEKKPQSQYVEAVWRTLDLTDGLYMAEADGCWDLIFITEPSIIKILLSGPTSRPTPTPYKTGNKTIGIRFKPGVIMTKAPAHAMHNVVTLLPVYENKTFEMFGSVWKIPDYETADNLILELENHGLLSIDEIVVNTLAGNFPSQTKRSVQRHFIKATALSYIHHRRIKQARIAIEYLRKGMSIADAALEAGYSDQAHMTRSLKKLAGLTPLQIKTIGGPVVIYP